MYVNSWKLGLGTKVLLIGIISIVAVSASLYFISVQRAGSLMLGERKRVLKVLVDMAYGEIQGSYDLYKNGEITEKEAKEAVKAKHLKMPVIALAKKLEEVYISEKEIISLPKTSPALKLLQQIRDEAHRFAISYNRSQRKNDFRFLLEQIHGIGKKRAMLLLTTFGSMEKIGKASLKELTTVPGIDRKIAKEIKKLI